MIHEGKIEALAPGLETGPDVRVFQAQGRVVCPGFIDVHAHDDLYLLAHPGAGSRFSRGDHGHRRQLRSQPGPVAEEHRSEALEQLSLLGGRNCLGRKGYLPTTAPLPRPWTKSGWA